MPIQIPKRVKSNADGIRLLMWISRLSQSAENSRIVLDFSDTVFFDANLFAFLGAWADFTESNNNTANFFGIKESIKNVMCKNGFNHALDTKDVSWNDRKDTYDTTLQYRKIRQDGLLDFKNIVSVSKLRGASGDITLMNRIAKEVNRNLVEIANNCFEHAGAEHIHVCGQRYSNNTLEICIVGNGKTIKENVSAFLDGNEYKTCIEWAVKEGHSTRKAVSGGLGLYNLVQSVKKNAGSLLICSADEYYEISATGRIISHKMQYSIPATLINLVININNAKSYASDEDGKVNLNSLL